MIDIPVKAEIECSDGLSGRCTCVIVNPVTKLVTHLVVKSFLPPMNETMVPVEQVEKTDPHRITLKCSRDELKKMEPFLSEEYIQTKVPEYEKIWEDGYLFWPYILPEVGDGLDEVDTYVAIEHENTPLGELGIHRGAKVEATDGPLGQIDELLINSTNMQVTHLIMRERHILKNREVAIPVSQIDHVNEDVVYLKIDKKSVEELPTVPVQRWSL